MGLFKRQKRRVEGDVREKKQIKREDQRNRSGLPLDDPKLKPLHDKKRNWEDGKTNEARNERGSMTEGDVYNQMLESIEQYPDEQNYAFLFSNVTPEQGEMIARALARVARAVVGPVIERGEEQKEVENVLMKPDYWFAHAADLRRRIITQETHDERKTGEPR